jgi:hypothetical protein
MESPNLHPVSKLDVDKHKFALIEYLAEYYINAKINPFNKNGQAIPALERIVFISVNRDEINGQEIINAIKLIIAGGDSKEVGLGILANFFDTKDINVLIEALMLQKLIGDACRPKERWVSIVKYQVKVSFIVLFNFSRTEAFTLEPHRFYDLSAGEQMYLVDVDFSNSPKTTIKIYNRINHKKFTATRHFIDFLKKLKDVR